MNRRRKTEMRITLDPSLSLYLLCSCELEQTYDRWKSHFDNQLCGSRVPGRKAEYKVQLPVQRQWRLRCTHAHKSLAREGKYLPACLPVCLTIRTPNEPTPKYIQHNTISTQKHKHNTTRTSNLAAITDAQKQILCSGFFEGFGR